MKSVFCVFYALKKEKRVDGGVVCEKPFCVSLVHAEWMCLVGGLRGVSGRWKKVNMTEELEKGGVKKMHFR
jgi:hypothetical protein